MITKFTDRFMAREKWLRGSLSKSGAMGYRDLVRLTIEAISNGETYAEREEGEYCWHKLPSPKGIRRVGGNEYQGNQLFLISHEGEGTPDWYVNISYGSCSGCDTLERIRMERDAGRSTPESQVQDYWTLCLHIAQSIRALDGPDACNVYEMGKLLAAGDSEDNGEAEDGA